MTLWARILRLLEWALFGAVMLAVVLWAGYHIWGAYFNPLEVETVFEYTKSYTVQAHGIAVRYETVIEDAASGIENYLYEDGTRVTVGQYVAEFYESAGSGRSVKRMREIQAEIAMLLSAQDKNTNNFANTEILNRDIRDQIGQLSIMSGMGQLGGAHEVRDSLTSLLNRRRVATGKEDGFEGRIAVLRAELESLERAAPVGAVVAATAPSSGYFVRTVDGYERYLSPATVAGYSISDYTKLIRTAINPPDTHFAGKIVTNHNWYFAVAMRLENAEGMVQGRAVTLVFASTGESVPAVIRQVLTERDNPDAVVIFHSEHVSGGTVNFRLEDVTIHVEEISGLRVNAQSLHYVDGVRGVFVVEDSIIRFKQVNPIYEEAGFVLTERNVVETPDFRPGEVRLYHQVITRGTDLYDGRALG
ncbi:MAG: hypothetical protein FWH02_08345 [Oscillospiraceae bacterium]|nr:hypothetical protein [Oscillospiraceae bacterium]